MTFREMLHHVMDRGASLHIYTTISNSYYESADIQKVCDIYTDVIRLLLEAPPGPVSDDINKDHNLRLSNITGEDGVDIVDVTLYDTVNERTYAVDFVDWVDLIDLMVEDKIGLSVSDQLAHILYEITFWGYNSDTMTVEKDKLLKAADEIESDLLRVDSLSGFLDSI